MAIMQQRLDEAEEELQAILEQIQSLVGQIAQLLSSESDTVNEIAMQMGQMA
jgi:prefoldin subunit 5